MISQAIFRKFCLLLLALEGCECKRYWDYDPISLTGHSSDETKLKPDLRVERVGRVPWTVNIIDYTTMVSFALPKKPVWTTKAVYDDILYPNIHRC